MQPLEMFLPTEMSLADWMAIDGRDKAFSGLGSDLVPRNVHILTLEDWTSPDRYSRSMFRYCMYKSLVKIPILKLI